MSTANRFVSLIESTSSVDDLASGLRRAAAPLTSWPWLRDALRSPDPTT